MYHVGAPEDVDPVVLHAPIRKSIGVFGAVGNSDGYLVIALAKKFDAIAFLSFLIDLRESCSSFVGAAREG
jgi:hypothetical protein